MENTNFKIPLRPALLTMSAEQIMSGQSFLPTQTSSYHQTMCTKATTNRGLKPICKEDWESLRPSLEKWYIKNGMTLKEILKLLADSKGLRVKKDQLSKRFKQWGLQKNVKAVERSLVMKAFARRPASATYNMGKIRISAAQIQRWEKEETEHEQVAGDDDASMELDYSPLGAAIMENVELEANLPSSDPERMETDDDVIELGRKEVTEDMPTKLEPWQKILKSRKTDLELLGSLFEILDLPMTTDQVMIFCTDYREKYVREPPGNKEAEESGSSQDLTKRLSCEKRVLFNSDTTYWRAYITNSVESATKRYGDFRDFLKADTFLGIQSHATSPFDEIYPFPPTSPISKNQIVISQRSAASFEEQISDEKKKLQEYERQFPDPEVTEVYGNTLHALGKLYEQVPDWVRAVEWFQKAVAATKRRHLPGSEKLLGRQFDLCLGLVRRGQLKEARSLKQETEQAIKRTFSADHYLTQWILHLDGAIMGRERRYAEAESRWSDLLRTYLTLNGPRNGESLVAMVNMCNAVLSQGNHMKGEELSITMVQIGIGSDVIGEEDQIEQLRSLALSWLGRGQIRDAEALYRSLVARSRGLIGANHSLIATCLCGLGESLTSLGRFDEAALHLKDALSVYKRAYGPQHDNTVYICDRLGQCYEKLGRYSDALKLYLEMVEEIKVDTKPDYDILLELYERIDFVKGKLDQGVMEPGHFEVEEADIEMEQDSVPQKEVGPDTDIIGEFIDYDEA